MNSTQRMALLSLSIILSFFLASIAYAQEVEASQETVQAFKAWVDSFSDDPTIKEKGQGYESLIEMKDADLMFLKGLYINSPIQRLSEKALARLKTDRSFGILVDSLTNENFGVRQVALGALAIYKEERCIAPIIQVLKSDPHHQVRSKAAYELREYDEKTSKKALMNALKDESSWVTTMAAYSLGVLEVEEAIDPIYRIIVNIDELNIGDSALDGLLNYRNKKAVGYLINLMEILPEKHGEHGTREAEKIDNRLLRYAKMTEPILGPVPDTVDQWRAWWKEAKDLFDERIQLADKNQQTKTYTNDEFETDVSKLKLIATLDSDNYRQGDPIKLNLIFQNTTDKPFRVVFPDPFGGPHPHMAWGIRLKSIGNETLSIIDIDPSPEYPSFNWFIPKFSTLHPRDEFRKSFCLQHWLGGIIKRPFPEGIYELIVSFDSSQFEGIKPETPEQTGLWETEPIRFEITGGLRDNPDEILEIIAAKTNKPWLKTDLTSRRNSRKNAAWQAVFEYGDERLLTILRELAGQDRLSENLHLLLREFMTQNDKSMDSQQVVRPNE